MDYIKVKDHEHLVRDKKSNAILNTDNIALDKYKQERDRIIKLNKMIEEYDDMKSDIKDIKNLLTILAEKK